MAKKKLLRDRLNEFQLDWAQAAIRSELVTVDQIKGKKVLLIGGKDSLSDAVAWSFEAWNDNCKAGISVERMSLDGELKHCAGPRFAPEEANYVILPGFCCKEISFTAEEEIDFLTRYLDVVRTAIGNACEKILLLSDGRVYGRLPHGFAASEYEAGETNPCAAGYEAQYFLQTLESIVVSCAREAGVKYYILRTGLILGAYIDVMEHGAYRLARTVAEGRADTLDFSAEQSSYVSIHDVLTAMHFMLGACPASKIFNIVGKEADASMSEMVTMLYRNFPDQCRIGLRWNKEKEEDTGILMNSQLIIRTLPTPKGVPRGLPKVTLEDGLIMLIKSMQEQEGIFIFDNTYLGKLTAVQELLLGYLLEIDRICKKHGIKYFLAGGTLLGAIRHHGFIPWDDDADVMMLREDYDRFMQIVQEEVPDNIFLQIPSTEKGNHNAFAKLRINNTMFSTLFTAKFLNMHNGVFFDILAHDKTANHKWSQKVHLYATILGRTLVFRKWGNTDIVSGGKHPHVCAVLNHLKQLVPMSWAEWFQERMLRFFQHRKSEYLYDGMGRNLKRGPFPKAWLDEAVYVDFEGYQFPVPKEYDKYLKWLYGDYMQMLPVSERRTSHSIVVTDLGEYSSYRCRNCR